MQACEAFVDLIIERVDGSITPEEDKRLEAHLKTCKGCRAFYRAYSAVGNRIADLEESPPPQMAKGVMIKLGAEQKRKSPKHWLNAGKFRLMAAAAAVVLLLVAAGQLRTLRPSSSTEANAEAMTQTATPQPSLGEAVLAAGSVAEAEAAEPKTAVAASVAADTASVTEEAPPSASANTAAVDATVEQAGAPTPSPTDTPQYSLTQTLEDGYPTLLFIDMKKADLLGYITEDQIGATWYTYDGWTVYGVTMDAYQMLKAVTDYAVTLYNPSDDAQYAQIILQTES